MSRPFPIVMIGVAAIGLLTVAGRGSDSGASPRFVATLTSSAEAGSKSLEMSVVFFGSRPEAGKAEAVVRKCLDAVSVLEGDADIVARAWFSTTSESADRQAITFADAANALVFRAADKTIVASKEKATESSGKGGEAEGADGDVAGIIGDAGVTDSCKTVAPDRLAKLADVAIESRGERRSQIVRGLRKWCKGNDVNLNRAMSLCVVAISKAAHQEPKAPVTTVADLAAAAARGAAAYKTEGCVKCHLATGRGGARAPDLTDDDWVHCDGSVAGISKVITSGVSQSQFKDPTRPFQMNATTGLSKAELTDLAAYVKSLSKE